MAGDIAVLSRAGAGSTSANSIARLWSPGWSGLSTGPEASAVDSLKEISRLFSAGVGGLGTGAGWGSCLATCEKKELFKPSESNIALPRLSVTARINDAATTIRPIRARSAP